MKEKEESPFKSDPVDLKRYLSGLALSGVCLAKKLQVADILKHMSQRLEYLRANSEAIRAIAARHKARSISVFGSV